MNLETSNQRSEELLPENMKPKTTEDTADQGSGGLPLDNSRLKTWV